MKAIFIFLISFFSLLPAFAEETVVLPSQIGIVQNVVYENIENIPTQTKQVAEIKILSGEHKNEILVLDNMLTGNPNYDIKLKQGTKVVLHAEISDDGLEFSIADIKRSGTLIWLSLVFCVLLLYVGRKKGLYSLVSIGLTVLLITQCLSPMNIAGISPVVSTLLICIVSTVITMYFVGGLNAKSTSASIGAIMSLVFAGILSYLTIFSAHLTGFAEENMLYLYSAHPELDFIGITISAMILATLGAVMDVAMSIASTINEIHQTDKTKSINELFQSGMNVGRDIIGTMANTLILVYMGGALPLLLLANNIDLQKFVNLNQVVTEVASALIGSIAIVICVPFTALAASRMIYKYATEIQLESIDTD